MNFFSFRRLLALALGAVPVLALAHGISAEDQQRMLDAGYFHYIELGARHMLTGYDHLLFLFGVVFFLTTFRDVAKFVTVFTIGHCITLIFATYFKSPGIASNSCRWVTTRWPCSGAS